MSNRYIIIPARLESVRFPNKLLSNLAGKTIIQHVYERSLQCNFKKSIIATDSKKIKEIAESFGAFVCMTKSNHQSGTERLTEAVEKLNISDEDIVINIQGDEPLIPIANIIQTADLLEHTVQAAVMSTLCEKITDKNEIYNSNCVKVAFNHEKKIALYFSRAPIPWQRDVFEKGDIILGSHYRHIGIYAYRASFLKMYTKMPISPLEKFESLEQLRVLWNDKKIAITEAKEETPIGVDTKEDLDRLRILYETKINKI